MTPAELSHTVLSAVRRAVAAEELLVEVPDRVVVRRPPRAGCGDYATNVALQLAGPAGRSAQSVAEILARRLEKEPGIAQVDIAGTGFLNITLSVWAYRDVVRQVRAQGSAYGYGDGLADDRPATVTAGPAEPAVPGEPAGAGPLRGQIVAEVVNRLLRAAGIRPAGPGEPWEMLVVQEPPAGSLTRDALGVSGAVSPAGGPPPGGPPAGDSLVGGSPAGGPVSGDLPPGGPPDHASASASASASMPAPSAYGEPPAGGVAIVEPATSPVTGSAVGPLVSAAVPPYLGPDATRWALLRPPAEDTPRLTPDLLEQRESNPLFRIRYAHARTRALVGNACDLGVEIDGPGDAEDFGPVGNPDGIQRREGADRPESSRGLYGPHGADAPDGGYHHPAETELLGLIADFPRVVESAARRRAPDRVARHLERLADAFFRFHDECPPLPKGDEKPSAAHAARIRLTDATGVVLAGGLGLLGISAPDRM